MRKMTKVESSVEMTSENQKEKSTLLKGTVRK